MYTKKKTQWLFWRSLRPARASPTQPRHPIPSCQPALRRYRLRKVLVIGTWKTVR
ncbi:hypothetical protein CMEL01_05765 [Colletotrichum melonis]|uniref:Uncharacterized protein n=3 Tax=Colletotrichum acutatum species complex TaxID=2707335 RepID=A0AAI9ZAH9_9PEZI|nr:uncharacterized protein CCOS01_01086 [Colletotrichum costaricense]XP_060384927.1 uncharacterized protein CTAM01_04252 [Colletotrichum tamarilloi]KAI3550829.1 hypothetical protein CSPX01_01324 [Colletotrichum filicis]KAK1454106.1 hypothetical protein CMEL01_05765 [Colletotrichum melonis]KAK1504022.1 hypothetical protein CTAM01_04252 [Colletotrichum tamarilloi]KAK1539772.1 hypothetical protein CCOS01_01086 [Colletotrichum costaricense]